MKLRPEAQTNLSTTWFEGISDMFNESCITELNPLTALVRLGKTW